MHRVQNYLHAFYAVFYRLMVVVILPAELNIIFFGVLGGLIQERRIVMHLWKLLMAVMSELSVGSLPSSTIPRYFLHTVYLVNYMKSGAGSQFNAFMRRLRQTHLFLLGQVYIHFIAKAQLCRFIVMLLLVEVRIHREWSSFLTGKRPYFLVKQMVTWSLSKLGDCCLFRNRIN